MKSTIQRITEGSNCYYKLIVSIAPIHKEGEPFEYVVTLKSKGKAKLSRFSAIGGTPSYYDSQIRSHRENERRKMEEILQHVTQEEIESLKMELWQSIKPTKY